MGQQQVGKSPASQESSERGIWVSDRDHRDNLTAFVQHVVHLDNAAVVRIRTRSDGALTAWVATGFDVLASRTFQGRIRPADISCGAEELLRALRCDDSNDFIDTGYPMDSAWRGGLPPETGFTHLDDLPATVFTELARRGTDMAREHGSAHGPPVSLLDHDSVHVSSGDIVVGIPMRCILALIGMGFISDTPDRDEIVRVRVLPMWLRIDARFGSVYRRRGASALLLS